MGKKRQNFKKLEIRKIRQFSVSFKQQIVERLVNKQLKVLDVSRLYKVSRSSVYNWLYKYSPHHHQGTKLVVEMESEAFKTKALLDQVADLERVVGRKQLEIDYWKKLVELSSEELQIDLKKNFDMKQSNGSGSTPDSTNTL